MANETLTEAKRAKNDEFYTQYADIEKEMNAYLEYDPDVFRNKTILLPCDDPEWSNFTKYFAQNFQRFGLKKLISTSYALESKHYQEGYQWSLLEMNDAKYDPDKTKSRGKIYTLTQDVSGDQREDVEDLEWEYLEGDGDFRSREVKQLRDEADVIITNPPFSLFREFLAWIVAPSTSFGDSFASLSQSNKGKKFAIIGNMNAITYKEVFPLIKEDRIWLGNGFNNGNAYFYSPSVKEYADGVYNPETGLLKFRNVCWFSNLDHGRRHQPLALMPMADNLKFSKHKEIQGKAGYDRYDNYDAIEVPFTDAIPSDYEGVMGVPISFLDKYSPEQFEIVSSNDIRINNSVPFKEHGLIKDKDGTINGKPTYVRIVIKKRGKNNP